jgi:mannose-1-phosphate guanylyltransferase
MDLHPVIMAGGSGTRFWPLSRKSRPKQFLPLASALPLITETANRLPPLSRMQDCWVVCGAAHAKAVHALLPKVPRAQVLVEPVARNTAPAIGLAAAAVAQKDPAGILVVLPSDHHVGDVQGFRDALAEAAVYARQGALVTLGITPSRAETGYGYIHLGEKLGKGPGRRVKAFVEKPDAAKAARYLKGKQHAWNAGIFLFRADTMLTEIHAHLPALSEGLSQLMPHFGKSSWTRKLGQVFPKLPSISIDYGVMEKAKNIVVVPAEFGWSDVGSFAAIPEVREQDAAGNVLSGLALALESSGCVLLADAKRPLAVVGARDLVVVDAGDAILVCPKDRAQDVRKVVDELTRRKLGRYL